MYEGTTRNGLQTYNTKSNSIFNNFFCQLNCLNFKRKGLLFKLSQTTHLMNNKVVLPEKKKAVNQGFTAF